MLIHFHEIAEIVEIDVIGGCRGGRKEDQVEELAIDIV
jgi:hypothetical protein